MNTRCGFPSVISLFAILIVISGVGGKAVAAAERQLEGHVPGVTAGLKSTGRLAGETQLNLAIGLTLRDQPGLDQLLQALYDPASPQYRHYLTSEQFTEDFAATPSDYAAVVSFARTNGFTVTAVHSDRMLLEVTAKVKDIERAFHLSMRLYPHPAEPRSFYAPDAEPSVPADLRIADISGLNNYLVPHPANLKRRPVGGFALNTSMDGSGPNGNFIGSDYRAAYAPGVTNTGTGQIVGLFEFDGFYPGDIAAYESQANITNPPPVVTNLISGFNGEAGVYDGEVALDIEMVMSMAPGLSEIVAFETSTNTAANAILSAMADSTGISQFACSWAFINVANPRAAMDQYFMKLDALGKTFLQASGDSGAYVGAIPEPSDDTNITIVGGTALSTCGPGGAWLGETSWNAPDIEGASGGGISTTILIPSWQVGVHTTANGASTTSPEYLPMSRWWLITFTS